MIFGRKRRAARESEESADASPDSPVDESDDVEHDDLGEDGLDEEGTVDDEDSDDEDSDDEDSEDDEDDEEDEDSDDEDSADQDSDEGAVSDVLREDGPFDLEEVDLDADDVARIDFGALVVTPIEGMELQLQVEEKSQTIQSALVVHEGAAIEVALFASPVRGGLAKEVLDELVALTEASGGTASVEEGPFGPQLFREVEVTTPEGQRGVHRSRIWLVEGPRWMLRAVLMGAALDDGTSGRELMEDFFRNLVVKRGTEPRAPGDLIPLTIPKNLAAQ
ncbi:DUF3710 domain-containing protein [Propionicicella superfundia]|uniref:DUF3710 domain-containing protein n=1 Tax=Propionicicella superfundia TaxID=348582 RepID=UPI0004098318|nr:DUF3710 domain-containing protein [Propionicicella superfundia]